MDKGLRAIILTSKTSACKPLLNLTIILLLVVVSGCVSPDEKEYRADEPILLYPAAGQLLGIESKDIVVRTRGMLPDRPLTTNLIRSVADEAKEAVVSIYVRSNTPYRLHLLPFSPLGGIPVKVPGYGLGSGFFIHPSGYIVTNNHIVKDAEQIQILTSAGRDYDVNIIARDPAHDLALLKVSGSPHSSFKVLPLGDSDVIDAGDMVIAVGNPLGLRHTVTSGIISQTYANLSGESDGGSVEFIQTDTAINPGSSGGPLITLNGACVGINTAMIAVAHGIGFAVPSNKIVEFLDNVRAGRGQKKQ